MFSNEVSTYEETRKNMDKKKSSSFFRITVGQQLDRRTRGAYQCFCTPQGVVLLTFLLCSALIILGTTFLLHNNAAVECKVFYENAAPDDAGNVTLKLRHTDCGKTADFKQISQDNIFVYYAIENFYQNNANYMQSVNKAQLRGEVITNKADVESCFPLDVKVMNGKEMILHPCGAAAWNVFNDKITIIATDATSQSQKAIKIDQDLVTIATDLPGTPKYKNPTEEQRSLYRDKVYFWMFPEETSYLSSALNSSDREILSALGGSLNYEEAGIAVENSHFNVWMHPAAFPNFRKLYGIAKGPLFFPIQIIVESRYNVTKWGGRKAIVLSTHSWIDYAGKMDYRNSAF
ncbi:hypothetical protein IE077_000210 [Cardiosporidium cionae]|uniref:Uncharacterized protein n=1 Tax=Cardiosporidium cionae TaxID=476202 RepID=A0ABQ7J525_9APIC|nr:hypothetical protein IE077_000210 [Cardiosporidium cionae]|eukprot:KAF8819087.1 hypothetical protein IE077_000210 [Cardiosporidium cionae]